MILSGPFRKTPGALLRSDISFTDIWLRTEWAVSNTHTHTHAQRTSTSAAARFPCESHENTQRVSQSLVEMSSVEVGQGDVKRCFTRSGAHSGRP